MRRGEFWWVDLGDGPGSGPAIRRPALVVSANVFNESPIRTVVVASLTTNLRLEHALGNFRVPATKATGLPKTSVVVVSQLATVDKSVLSAKIGRLPDALWPALRSGLALVLGL